MRTFVTLGLIAVFWEHTISNNSNLWQLLHQIPALQAEIDDLEEIAEMYAEAATQDDEEDADELDILVMSLPWP